MFAITSVIVPLFRPPHSSTSAALLNSVPSLFLLPVTHVLAVLYLSSLDLICYTSQTRQPVLVQPAVKAELL